MLAGISVTREDLGSCPVLVPIFDNQAKKVLKIYMDFKNLAQYVAEDHTVILVWEC